MMTSLKTIDLAQRILKQPVGLKDRRISIKVSDLEFETYHHLAETYGLSLSAVIRLCLDSLNEKIAESGKTFVS